MASRVLQNRKVKVTLIAAATLLGIYLAIGSWVNRIYIYKQTVDNAWVALKQNCNHRAELLGDWGNFISHFSPESTSVLQDLKSAYKMEKQTNFTVNILHERESLQRFVNTQQIISLTLQRMYTAFSNQPQLVANLSFRQLNIETQTVELQIVHTSKTLNESIAQYNDSISGIPGGWVNVFLKYPPLFTFSLPEMVLTPKTPLSD